TYRGNFYYDLVKTSVIRLAYSLSEELRPHRVTVLAVTPGFLRSEAMLEHFGVTEANWQDGAKKDPHFIPSETPFYVARAVAAIFIVIPVIYLVALPAATGLALADFSDPFKLRPVIANPVFDLADFLFGPVWGISLVIATLALRERIGEAAPRRMFLALLAA